MADDQEKTLSETVGTLDQLIPTEYGTMWLRVESNAPSCSSEADQYYGVKFWGTPSAYRRLAVLLLKASLRPAQSGKLDMDIEEPYRLFEDTYEDTNAEPAFYLENPEEVDRRHNECMEAAVQEVLDQAKRSQRWFHSWWVMLSVAATFLGVFTVGIITIVRWLLNR